MPRFDLSVQALTVPSTSSSMRFNDALLFSRGSRDPLYPATRLQLAYAHSSNSTEIFHPRRKSHPKTCCNPRKIQTSFPLKCPLSEIPRARRRSNDNSTGCDLCLARGEIAGPVAGGGDLGFGVGGVRLRCVYFDRDLLDASRGRIGFRGGMK